MRLPRAHGRTADRRGERLTDRAEGPAIGAKGADPMPKGRQIRGQGPEVKTLRFRELLIGHGSMVYPMGAFVHLRERTGGCVQTEGRIEGKAELPLA